MNHAKRCHSDGCRPTDAAVARDVPKQVRRIEAGILDARMRAVGGGLSAVTAEASAGPDASHETALAEAVALARSGEWAQAERVIHATLRAVPPERLPQAYIACVDAVGRLLALPVPDGAQRFATAVGIDAPLGAPNRRPRTFPDPALDYAYAVLTALRGRLAAGPTDLVRRASWTMRR